MCRKFGLFIFISSLFIAPAAILTSIPYLPPGSPAIQSVALDSAGNIYIAGTTSGAIPLVNAFQSKLGGGNCADEGGFTPCPNIFVAKFDPTGKKLIYSTYLGGDQSDFEAGLAVDSAGNAYIAGTTLPAGWDQGPGAGNAFVKKLSPDGSALLYTHYLGGTTAATGVAVDASGNASIVGYNLGSDFPSVHPLPVQPFVKSLYVTNDGGLTWRGLNNGLSATNLNSLAVDPTNPATLYAATSSGLYKSTNAGSDWTRMLPTAAVAENVIVDPKNPSTVYLFYTDRDTVTNYLARSIDAGKTWTNISDNFPAVTLPAQPTTFALDPKGSNVLWAMTVQYPRLWVLIKSTDAGDHWQVIYTFPQDNFRGVALVGEKLLIDPQNSSRLYACCIHDPFGGGIGGVYRSDDGGKTWIRGGTGPFAGTSGIVSPWLDPHDSSVLYGDLYDGLERSTDAGLTWAKVNLPTGLASYGYEPAGLALYASGTIYLLNDSGYLLKSSDRGTTWTKITGPWAPFASILAIDPTNPSTLYVASGAAPGPAGTPAQHAFAARLSAAGEIQWATLFGGSGQDQALAVALDSSGNAFITGNTTSDDFPLVNPFQAVRGGSTILATAAFVTKISADGSNILYSSFLGGTGIDSGNAIAVDAAGSAYIAGGTTSVDFPIVGPFEPQPVSPITASFVAKVDPSGGRLVYSTLVAGSQNYYTEQANAIVVDPDGRAFVAGITGDAAFPLVNPIQPTVGLGSSFVALLSPSGDSLDFSTYLGDLNDDIDTLALAPNGTLWIAGNGGLDRIDFEVPPAQPGVPQVFAVYNAASYRLGDVVAAGEIVTLIGQELAPVAQTASSRSLPRSMQGVTVFVAGVAAPLFYVSPKQINFQVPVETPFAGGPLVSQLEPLVVQRGTKVSATRTVDVQRFAPGLFAATADVRGTPVVVHTSDFSLVTQQNPAHPGEYLAAFCTGLGATNPPAKSGEPAPAAAPVTDSVTAQELDTGAPILVSYAGLAPGWAGLYQINFQLSETETAGQRNILFSIQGYSTNQGAIWVQ